MVHWTRAVALVAAATMAGCGGSNQNAAASALEARVARLEAEVQSLRTASAPSPARAAVEAVPVVIGDVELHDGDAITITDVRGTASRLKVGGSYVIRGRYTLQSLPEATLLLSVTTNGPSGHAPVPPGASVRVTRGSGEFELHRELTDEGWPHLTFYDVNDGHPVGGVYFGEGDWLLAKKSWRYRTP